MNRWTGWILATLLVSGCLPTPAAPGKPAADTGVDSDGGGLDGGALDMDEVDTGTPDTGTPDMAVDMGGERCPEEIPPECEDFDPDEPFKCFEIDGDGVYPFRCEVDENGCITSSRESCAFGTFCDDDRRGESLEAICDACEPEGGELDIACVGKDEVCFEGEHYTCEVRNSATCAARVPEPCEDGEFCDGATGACTACEQVQGCDGVDATFCSIDGKLQTCIEDERGCLVQEDDGFDCAIGTACFDGECQDCSNNGAGCSVIDETRCSPTFFGKIETCRVVNNCLVWQVDMNLSCDAGQECKGPVGAPTCESCHIFDCENQVAGDPVYCVGGVPNLFSTCVEDMNGCRTTMAPSDCGPDTFCQESPNAPTACVDCSTLGTVCSPHANPGDPSNTRCNGDALEQCLPDPATGCYLWTEQEDCAAASPNGGVCANQGDLDPRDSSALSVAACLDNDCDTLTSPPECAADAQSVVTCIEDPSTGLEFYAPTNLCGAYKTCVNAACVCDKEQTRDCFDRPVSGEVFCDEDNGLTSTCQMINGCSAPVPQNTTLNPCNDPSANAGDYVDCGTDSEIIIACEAFGGTCLQGVEEECPCNSGLAVCPVTGRQNCTSSMGVFSCQ